MITVTPRQPMTPIEVTSQAYRLRADDSGERVSDDLEIWEARSLDGLWLYERTEDRGTPWLVTYVPTGQVEYFGSLPAARRWTASDRAIPYLRIRAREVIRDEGRTGAIITRRIEGRLQRVPEDPAECAARVAEAERWLAILDGQPAAPAVS